MKLEDREWVAIPITKLFSRFEAGKISNASAFHKSSNKGIEYIAATNRNNGVLFFIDEDNNSKKVVQLGNCIGFIKDGDGSAGYAIYKKENFASTVNVIYGYAPWLNLYSGLSFVAAQDKIKNKYNHGYKRNLEHLKGDRVMLPVKDNGEPNYEYLADYAKSKEESMLDRYKVYAEKELSGLEFKEIPALDEKEWKEIPLDDLFIVNSGKRLENRNKRHGIRPFIGATDNGNGITGFVSNDNDSKDKNVLGINYNGAPCIAFYHPYECIFSDDVKRLHLKEHFDNKYILLFFVSIFAKQKTKYNYGYKFNAQRMIRQMLMVPINEDGTPDYDYMEQYAKNLMYNKYNQYLSYLKSKSR